MECLLWLLALPPVNPLLALFLDRSAWASWLGFCPFLSLGMVPTNLEPTGLDVAIGWPGVGLGSLLLLGPACEAGGPDPDCSLEVLVMVMALAGDLGLLASLAMEALSACFCCHICL